MTGPINIFSQQLLDFYLFKEKKKRQPLENHAKIQEQAGDVAIHTHLVVNVLHGEDAVPC